LPDSYANGSTGVNPPFELQAVKSRNRAVVDVVGAGDLPDWFARLAPLDRLGLLVRGEFRLALPLALPAPRLLRCGLRLGFILSVSLAVIPAEPSSKLTMTVKILIICRHTVQLRGEMLSQTAPCMECHPRRTL
jgi:hypothetical protein